ncbi:hypothetical protein WDU94_003101 [Cyamophila willieti]
MVPIFTRLCPQIFLCLAVIWLVCLLTCIPPFFRIAPYSYDPDLASCVPDFKSGKISTVWYSGFFIVSTFLLPATVIVICNIKVLLIARYHRHRIASAIFEVTLSAQVTITHQKNPFYNSFTLNKFLTRNQARTPSTCGSRRPSLTPLGILTKPAPLIRRSSEIGMESNNNNTNSISKSSSNSGTKKHYFINLSSRQMSTSTSKLSLSTQEKLTGAILTTSVGNHHHRMSNSVQNIPSNKSFFHIK